MKVYSKIRDVFRRTGKYKFLAKTQDTPLSKTDQEKIKKQYPNAKFGPKENMVFHHQILNIKELFIL